VRERDHLEGLGVDGRIILRWILKKWDGQVLNGLVWPWKGTGGGAPVNAVMNLRVP
jgi:hypothetical protein